MHSENTTYALVGEGQETDLVQGIGRVGDDFTQEDVLVLVQRVDDDIHQAVHLRLELVGLHARFLFRRFRRLHLLFLSIHVERYA